MKRPEAAARTMRAVKYGVPNECTRKVGGCHDEREVSAPAELDESAEAGLRAWGPSPVEGGCLARSAREP